MKNFDLEAASPREDAADSGVTGELDVSDLQSAEEADVMSVEDDWVEEGWSDAADTSRGPAVADVIAEAEEESPAAALKDASTQELDDLEDLVESVAPEPALLDASTQELDDLEALALDAEPAPAILDASTQELDDLEELVDDLDAAEELDLDELEVEELQAAAPSIPPPPPGKRSSMPPPPPGGSLPPPPPPPSDD